MTTRPEVGAAALSCQKRGMIMARLEDIPQPTRDAVQAVPCPSFDTHPFVVGPPLAERRVAIVSSAAISPSRSAVPNAASCRLPCQWVIS
jgi:hypothetical protein